MDSHALNIWITLPLFYLLKLMFLCTQPSTHLPNNLYTQTVSIFSLVWGLFSYYPQNASSLIVITFKYLYKIQLNTLYKKDILESEI